MGEAESTSVMLHLEKELAGWLKQVLDEPKIPNGNLREA